MSRIILRNATLGVELLWRRVKINKSLDEICHTLEAEIPPQEKNKVRRHDKIEVRYENPLVSDSGGRRCVTTVLVDEITADAGISKHSLRVIGRSPARDIIDSRWSETCQNQKLGELLDYICGKFNIASDTFPTDKPDPTGLVTNFNFENESPWAKLIAEADNQGYILTSNEIGNLYLWEVGAAARPGYHLTEGVNIKDIKWTENGAEQYREYVVNGGDGEARVTDDTCRSSRILTINLTDEDIPQQNLNAGRKRKCAAAASGALPLLRRAGG